MEAKILNPAITKQCSK